MVDLVQKFPEFVDRLPGMKAVTSTRITTIERIATWWMMIVATYLIYGQLWGQTIVDHWGEGGVPDWFKNPVDGLPPGFAGTFLDDFPGLTVSWYGLTILETISFAALLASVFLFEWLPRRHRPMFQLAIGISAVTFAILAFGELLQNQKTVAFQLFLYFGVALMTPFLIDWLDRAVNKERATP